jgi:tRNA U38,U39,U40 pseudouridine synthase TruA
LHEDFVLKENINLEAEIPKNANEEIRKMKLALLMKKNVDKERIVKLVNSFLPADIRAHGMKLVSKGFCIRKKATSRLYQYCMPLFMYQAYKELEEGKKLTE